MPYRGVWMTSCTGSERGGFWGIWKKSASWVLPREKTVDFLLLVEALRRIHTCWGGGGDRWKIQNRKNVYLSPYVEKPFNSKVIKSFVPALRSRKCFSCFGIPMFYVYMLWTFYVRFPYPDIWQWYSIRYTCECVIIYIENISELWTRMRLQQKISSVSGDVCSYINRSM